MIRPREHNLCKFRVAAHSAAQWKTARRLLSLEPFRNNPGTSYSNMVACMVGRIMAPRLSNIRSCGETIVGGILRSYWGFFRYRTYHHIDVRAMGLRPPPPPPSSI